MMAILCLSLSIIWTLLKQLTILLTWDRKGGVGGGQVIATGTPEQVAEMTGKLYRTVFEGKTK